MGKIGDLFKKIWRYQGNISRKMGTMKDRNDIDLTKTEDINKKWQEYTEELHILKSRDISLLTKVHLVKAMVFQQKAECQRIDAFELWCWRRLLIVPWTARKSNQSILKEISAE